MTLEASVIKDDSLRSTPSGYEMDVRIAWYRSLPIACLENLAITIDGQTFESDQISIKIKDALTPVKQVGELLDEWWFTQDPITAVINAPSPLKSGDVTTVSVSLATRIPYIIIGPDIALVQRTDVSKEVTIQ